MKILIVEDDLSSRLLLQKILSPIGDCDVAVNGLEALSAFNMAWKEGQPYDLIMLDIQMPEMDGQEALKEIRKREGDLGVAGCDNVKIVMMTGFVDSENLRKAFMAGCEAYLLKPILKKKLLDQIRQLGLIE